jgi:predicted unusual protein kinase regulating ubiquinone biosynthesis (AarF/ABC1/UbiB family)
MVNQEKFNNKTFTILSSVVLLTTSTIYIIMQILSFKLGIINQDAFLKRVRDVMEWSGPIYIKYGQIMASRVNFQRGNNLFKNVLVQFSSLEDNVHIRSKVKEKEYQQINIIDDVKLVNNVVIGSGSIASVYDITYKNKEAVLKIVHPDITNKIILGTILLKAQLKIFSIFIKELRRASKFINFNEMKRSIIKQTVMTNEKNAINKMKQIFLNDDVVIIPKVYNYSDNYIIMSKEQGKKFYNFIESNSEYDYEAVASLYYSVKKMINGGFLHIDLHLGNFFFKLVNKQVKLVLLDFGIVKTLSKEEKEILLNIIAYKRNKESREKDSIKFFWIISGYKKNYDLNQFNKLVENYKKKKKLNFKNVLDFFNTNKIIVSYENTLLLNSVSFVLELMDNTFDNINGFRSFLGGYLMEHE